MQVKNQYKKTHFGFIVFSLIMILGLFAFKSYGNKVKKELVVPIVEAKTALNTLQITIREKHYKKLRKKRNKALADGILETDDNDYVPGVITFNGKDYLADLRLKGDWTDHLEGEKWSYRIKLKNDQTIFGMRKFSIHHPKTRGYINEWLFHKANKKEGIMGLRYHFAEGFMHINLKDIDSTITKDVGIYAVEETFDKRTIESNARKEGVILRISEQYFWKEVKQGYTIENQVGNRWRTAFSPTYFLHNSAYVSTFGYSNILENESLLKQFVHAKNLLELYRQGVLTSPEVFDVKKLALYTAINNLFGAYHGLSDINYRYYYNPTTSMLEPIAYDGQSGQKINKFHHYFNTNKNMDPVYKAALIEALAKVSTPNYLDAIFNSFYEEASVYENILKTEFGEVSIIKKENYMHNQAILKKELLRLKQL